MAIDSKSLVPLHDLTEEGKENYKKLLEYYADQMLERHNHPIRYYLAVLRERFGGHSD